MKEENGARNQIKSENVTFQEVPILLAGRKYDLLLKRLKNAEITEPIRVT